MYILLSIVHMEQYGQTVHDLRTLIVANPGFDLGGVRGLCQRRRVGFENQCKC